jgi:hypothetical protein
MDDPDVDHELIALLRESLGISNKAQDVVTSDTGKGDIFSLFMCRKIFIWTVEPVTTTAWMSTALPHSSAIIITLLTTS